MQASKTPVAGISSPPANTWTLKRPPVSSSTIRANFWALPCKMSRAGGHMVGIRHCTRCWAMTLGASTTDAAPAATSTPPAFAKNLRRSMEYLLRRDQQLPLPRHRGVCEDLDPGAGDHEPGHH